jgi:2-phosphosulfolactate phosphatase
LNIRSFIEPNVRPILSTPESVWVTDVLRMSSTLITALSQGCKKAYLVKESDDALALARTFHPPLLTIGERHGKKLAGFDFNNSPRALSELELENREIVITSTNGTKRLVECYGGSKVGTFSFLNLSATAKQMADDGYDLVLVAAGRRGVMAIEDTLAIGALIEKLPNWVPSLSLDETSRYCLAYWHEKKSNFSAEILSSDSGRHLIQLGFEADVYFCTQIDTFEIVASIVRFSKGKRYLLSACSL